MFIDAHCDTLTELYKQGKSLAANDLHVDVTKLAQSSAQFFAIFLDQKRETELFAKTLQIIDFFYQEMERHKDRIAAAKTVQELEKNAAGQKISAVLSIEGGEILEGNLDALQTLYTRGVRAMTLTWNYDNALASGAWGNDAGGLTDFGREVVARMNEIGMLVDVSHLNDKGFYEVLAIAKKPLAATHSNARRIHPVKRNVTDDQIRLLAEKGGVIGINLYPAFLGDAEVTSETALRHIDHMLRVGGTECVGLGCDFDGIDQLPRDMKSAKDISVLLEKIAKQHNEAIAEKIAGKNFLRLLSEVWKNPTTPRV